MLTKTIAPLTPQKPVDVAVTEQAPINGAVTEKKPFDDAFTDKFFALVTEFKSNPDSGPITAKDRRAFIESAYEATDKEYFGGRQLSDHDQKMRAMTKVFYKVLADEPWKEEWIRPHDVERKLSRWEMHHASVELAAQHGLHTPREAVAAAREHLLKLNKMDPKGPPGDRGPYDDIELVYIAGTVSSTATNKIDRDAIYPVSVSSVANVLQNHICREMNRPYEMAEKFVTCTDTDELIKLRQFACDVVDFASHLLDNDNVSLLIVLLILARSEITRRFENNGIRIEGSTISHRRAECLKTKLGWKNAEERKAFDNVSTELQTRVKNACFPAPRGQRAPRRAAKQKAAAAAGQAPPHHVHPAGPPTGYFPPPMVHLPQHFYNHPPPMMGPPLNYTQPLVPPALPPQTPLQASPRAPPLTNGVAPANAVAEPMDTS